MIEVLVTIVILSVGLLGLASLQANGLKSNHQAYMRSQATILAYDMSDRMRANMAGVNAGSYNNLSGDPSTTPPDCETNTCTPANMAAYDYAKWDADLANRLPLGQGSVAIAGGIATVTVMWDDDREGTGTDCTGSASTNLKCFQVALQL